VADEKSRPKGVSRGAPGQIVLPDIAINPFRIRPPEGQMMSIMKGNRDGELDTIVASLRGLGYHFRYQEREFKPEDWEIVDRWDLLPDKGTSYTQPTGVDRGLLDHQFGVFLVGLGKALFIPEIHYSKWEQLREDKAEIGKKKGDWYVVSKDRVDSPYYYFQYNLAVPVDEVELKGNLKVALIINLPVRIINPYKAIHLVGGWESLLTGAVNGRVRQDLGNRDYDYVREQKEDTGELVRAILSLNTDPKDEDGNPERDENDEPMLGFRSKFGVEVYDVRIMDFKIIGSEEAVKAAEAKAIAKLYADAAVEKAREIQTIGAATANAAAMANRAYGGGGAAAAVRAAELMKEAVEKNTTATVLSINTPGGVPVVVTPPEKK